jgi:hypothetical protein
VYGKFLNHIKRGRKVKNQVLSGERVYKGHAYGTETNSRGTQIVRRPVKQIAPNGMLHESGLGANLMVPSGL